MQGKEVDKCLRITEILGEVIDGILIREVKRNSILRSSLPVSNLLSQSYSILLCTQVLLCFFMKRFTGHTEGMSTFLDAKHWPEIKIENMPDSGGHQFCDRWLQSTGGAFWEYQKLEQLISSDADILILHKVRILWYGILIC